ncbi:hypothetical protein BDF14DRAFT_1860933, partial [Spinellus fusiger]
TWSMANLFLLLVWCTFSWQTTLCMQLWHAVLVLRLGCHVESVTGLMVEMQQWSRREWMVMLMQEEERRIWWRCTSIVPSTPAMLASEATLTLGTS